MFIKRHGIQIFYTTHFTVYNNCVRRRECETELINDEFCLIRPDHMQPDIIRLDQPTRYY